MSNGNCVRCKVGRFNGRGHCVECGVHRDRKVMSVNSARRRGRIGGKRGKNSGKVSNHGKK